jgi:hypothetical protein
MPVRAEPGYAGEWKKTRLYGHSYDSGDFTDEEYDWIRDNFEYFTIEKTHMRSDYGNPSHEQTSKICATRLIAANPNCKPLLIYSIGSGYPQFFESEAAALISNPEYFTYEDDGITVDGLNVSNSGENDWYIDTLNTITDSSDLYGTFLDGYKSTHTAHPENVQYMSDRITGFKLANGMDFAPNGLTIRSWPEELEHVDGVFIDSFFRRRVMSADAGVVLIDACMAIPEDKMFVCFSAYDGYSPTFEFSHAAYLIVAHENTYYRWVDEGDNLWSSESLMTWHDEFGYEMGAPLGDAVKNGYVYTRVFEHCTVTLDVENITSNIEWGQNNGIANEAPTATSDSYSVNFNEATSILLTGTDPEGSNLTFSVVDLPSYGSLTGIAPALTYTPTTDYTGADSFTFTVNDGVYTSALSTITIQVIESGSITWTAANNISDVNDVSTNGTPVWAYSFGAAGTAVVNGVTFIGESNAVGNADVMTDLDQSFTGYGNSSGTFNMLASEYQSILESGAYSGAANITLSGLSIGNEYEVQFWLNDSRNRTDMDSTPRSATITDTSYAVDYNTAGASTNDGLGQYIIGTFTAVGTMQDIALETAVPQLNAIQLRQMPSSNTSSDAYSVWIAGYGLSGSNSLYMADSENGGIGDGYNNLEEFALGMNPAIADADSKISVSIVDAGGANWFEIIHDRRSDYLGQGLSYLLIESTNLVNSTIYTNAQDQILVGDAVDGYEPVTNRYEIDGPTKFIQIKIQQD